MEREGIKVYGRIKPTARLYPGIELSDSDSAAMIDFNVPRQEDAVINNKKEHYKFQFDYIFPVTTTQDAIFEVVAQPVADRVMEGYNGTVFAYGQTGSGKTFTMTGGAERYEDRGIIPRTLSYLFLQYTKQPQYEFTTQVSYLEIYNENGYDLLDPNHEFSKIEDLPKVSLLEGLDGDVQMRNMSLVTVSSEEDALNSLFIGDTNRMIAETPMNMASTRSHCIFTIYTTRREKGGATLRKAKLHLVDLAGSERIKKSGVGGTLLQEAKYINLSLHYLEQVIVALSEKSRGHIPYRNSLMTSVLRDSLGGNCLTTMIATMSGEKGNVDESISTCRFAQRVALIKNDVSLNEELDPKLLIEKLKKENTQLREELALATGGHADAGPLGAEDLVRCKDMVRNFLADSDPDARLVLGDIRKITECFRLLKAMNLERPALPTPAPTPSTAAIAPDPAKEKELQRLSDLLRQRDNEISILTKKIREHREKEKRGSLATTADSQPPSAELQSSRSFGEAPLPTSSAALQVPDHQKEAFEFFSHTHPMYQSYSDNKVRLKSLVDRTKALGDGVLRQKGLVGTTKAEWERICAEAAEDAARVDPVAAEIVRRRLEDERLRYKEMIGDLGELKKEYEHVKHLVTSAKVKMVRDFEAKEAAAASEPGDRLVDEPRHASRHPHGNVQTVMPVIPPIPASRDGKRPSSDSSARFAAQDVAPVQRLSRTPPDASASANASTMLAATSRSHVSGAPSASSSHSGTSAAAFQSDLQRPTRAVESVHVPGTPPQFFACLLAQAEAPHFTHILSSIADPRPARAVASATDDDIEAFFKARDSIRGKR
eukprot:m.451625 g.451625  ORF g.451625 m.451625 type:complete len:829 (+) comp56919_c0_seq9:72-2558(+)